jgi:hypothetical protein
MGRMYSRTIAAVRDAKGMSVKRLIPGLAVVVMLALIVPGAVRAQDTNTVCQTSDRLRPLQQGEAILLTSDVAVGPFCAVETENGYVAVAIVVTNQGRTSITLTGRLQLQDQSGNRYTSLAVTEPEGYATVYPGLASVFRQSTGSPVLAETQSIPRGFQGLIISVFQVSEDATSLELVRR